MLNSTHWIGSNKIQTAVVLAAGTGSRLMPLTTGMPKCLTEINGIPILEKLLQSLVELKFKKVIFIVGYLENQIRSFVQNTPYQAFLEIEYIVNPVYSTTNNIYSLWMARNQIQEEFLLLESDLIFDPYLLEDLLVPDRIAIANYESFMNGTRVKLNSKGDVSDFFVGNNTNETSNLYKTVNIYSFTVPTWKKVIARLDQWIQAGKIMDYYEAVFSELVDIGRLLFKGVHFDSGRWYEVDTVEDLREAERLFAPKINHALNS